MRSILTTVVAFVGLAASPAFAQSDFTALKALPGDRVFITQANGVEVGGNPLGAREGRSAADGEVAQVTGWRVCE